MLRKYTKFVVFALTILSALVLSEYVEMRFDQGSSLKGIALKMLITLIVYIPVFGILEKYLQMVSKAYAKGSKGLLKSSFWGLTIGFLVALLVLYILLVYVMTGHWITSYL